jgi:transcriptional regulator GlxA family with amidase domain
MERLFGVSVGLRPAAVYRQLRLRYARWLLENTTRSITDVALEAGFSDCAHFSRQFKELFALTPTEARTRRRSQVVHPLGWSASGPDTSGFVDRRLFD